MGQPTARRVAYLYHPRMSQHVLRPDHPFRPVRLQYTYELLEAYGAFQLPGSRLLEPPTASDEELLLVHTRDYIERVRAYSASGRPDERAALYGFSMWGDNPIYQGMFEANALATGATLQAARLLLAGEVDVAFSPAGGLHHAMPSAASGFCVFNDPAIAIEWLRRQGLRVAYVDIDAHHGDGVQHVFYDTDQVLTISLHESGRYLFPGTGFVEEYGRGRGRGYSVNVPLAPYTDDATYRWAFEEIVPPLVEAFHPDILVTQLGIDTYFNDPLAHLLLTVQGFTGLVERLAGLCPKWLALGGGGYDLSAVARGWASAYGVMLGVRWPNEIPEPLQARCGTSLADQEPPQLDERLRQQVRQVAEEAVKTLKELVFPVHGLR